MRIRVVRNFSTYKAGQEFDWSEGMAKVMVARGLIEPVQEPEPEPEPEPEAELEEAVRPIQPLERAVDHHRRKPKR
jgi:hypothetical protein